MRRSPALLALAMSICLTATACGGSPTRSGGPRRSVGYAADGTFTYAIPDDLGTFDPYHSGLIFGYDRLAYDSLVNQRPDGAFVSGLAEKWTADAQTAVFTLRNGITCSDGTPLTASQVAADLTYLGDPDHQSPQYGRGVPAAPFTATGDDRSRTVKVVMKSPFGFLLHTVGLVPIVCAKGLKNPKMLKSASDGTGPFVLSGVDPGQSYTFTAREDYAWGPGGATTRAPGTPAKVVLRVVPNEATAANLLLSGEVNIAQIKGQDRERLDAQRVDKVQTPISGAWLWFNQQDGRPGGDKRFRQALVGALDRDQVVKISTAGAGRAATGLIVTEPRPCPGDTVSGRLPAYDRAAAETLLDQAGWTKGADGTRAKDGRPLTVDLHYISVNEGEKAAAEFMAQQWRAIGVRVKPVGDSYARLDATMFQTGDWDIYIAGFGSSLPTRMVLYVTGPVPPKGTNIAGIDNKTYGALAAKAAALVPSEACTYWNQAEHALYADINPAPIAQAYKTMFLHNARVEIGGLFPIPTSIRVLAD